MKTFRDLWIIFFTVAVLFVITVALALAQEADVSPDPVAQLANQIIDFLSKLIVPVLTTVILGGARKYLPAAMQRIPGWLMPILAAFVGAATGTATGATDPTLGVISGLAGTGLHQIKAQAKKEE